MIGIIDSGVGGLSVLNEIHTLLPQENLLYIGDSAWCPYGNKTASQIQKRVAKHTEFLLEKGASLIVLACNSATITSIEYLRATYPIPFVGMEPALKPAANQTATNVIGVLATEASLAGEKFHQLVNSHAQHLKIITVPCPDFVTLVENGQIKGSKVNAAIQKYTDPLIEANADVLVLGCTHYPFLLGAMEELLPKNIRILHTGSAVAKHVANLRKNTPHLNVKSPTITLWTTGEIDQLNRLYPILSPHITATTMSLK